MSVEPRSCKFRGAADYRVASEGEGKCLLSAACFRGEYIALQRGSHTSSSTDLMTSLIGSPLRAVYACRHRRAPPLLKMVTQSSMSTQAQCPRKRLEMGGAPRAQEATQSSDKGDVAVPNSDTYSNAAYVHRRGGSGVQLGHRCHVAFSCVHRVAVALTRLLSIHLASGARRLFRGYHALPRAHRIPVLCR